MNIHKKAKLTPLGRERMVQMMLDGHTSTKAAALAGVSPVTAKKWLVRSPAGMQAYIPVGVFPNQKAGSAIAHPPACRRQESRFRLLQTRLRQAGASASLSNGS